MTLRALTVMKNHCGSCVHEWTSRAKSGVSKVCPSCKSKDVRIGEWRAAPTPTGPQMNVAPPYAPPPPPYAQQWAPAPFRRTSSTGMWIAFAVGGVVLVFVLATCGAILSGPSKTTAAVKPEPATTNTTAIVTAAGIAPAPVPTLQPAVAPKLQPAPRPTPVAPAPLPAPRPAPAPAPAPAQVTGCAAAGMSTCGDGSCGCYGRGCCSHHGGIAR